MFDIDKAFDRVDNDRYLIEKDSEDHSLIHSINYFTLCNAFDCIFLSTCHIVICATQLITDYINIDPVTITYPTGAHPTICHPTTCPCMLRSRLLSQVYIISSLYPICIKTPKSNKPSSLDECSVCKTRYW